MEQAYICIILFLHIIIEYLFCICFLYVFILSVFQNSEKRFINVMYYYCIIILLK